MFIGVSCFLVFLAMASLMYTRRLSALMAVPLMAISIAVVGGIPAPDILNQVINAGSLKLHVAYTTTMFGAVLAELVNKQGIAKSIIRYVAEFAGDNPFLLGILLTAVVALLFSTLGGLGAVIMVGTVVLPVMLSLGISNITAGCLFLFGISLGGMFNLSNWQLYTDVLGIQQAQIASFVVPYAGIMAVTVITFLGIRLGKLKNLIYPIAAAAIMGSGYALLSRNLGQAKVVSAGLDQAEITGLALSLVLLFAYAAYRQFQKISTIPSIAFLTPFIPLLLVLGFHFEIIPAFVIGITYGVLTTWQSNSISLLTRSILDGINAVIPAVALMIGIGMLLAAVMHPNVAGAMAPLMSKIIPTHAVTYVIVFTILAPLALYRGPLSLWGMGSGIVGLMQRTTRLSASAIMGMLMSVGQVQGVCDPTNTSNIWIATYLATDTQALLAATIPYVWVLTLAGLILAVSSGYVPF